MKKIIFNILKVLLLVIAVFLIVCYIKHETNPGHNTQTAVIMLAGGQSHNINFISYEFNDGYMVFTFYNDQGERVKIAINKNIITGFTITHIISIQPIIKDYKENA
jgi:hypothetical protein